MSTTMVSNPAAQVEFRSAKKKRAKAEASANASSAGSATPNAEVAETPATAEVSGNGGDGALDSPYLRELNKNMRNTVKKLNATAKVDAIIAENPGKSLDELVVAKKINNDQKAQALKKPGLEATKAQLEEQIAQYKKFGADYEARFATEKSTLESSHRGELQKVKEATVAETKESLAKRSEEDLLILSRFLRAAAQKRQTADETTDESRAFEGALLLVYGGDLPAVAAIRKLVSGSEDKVAAVDGELLEFTYSQVKQLALDYPTVGQEEAYSEDQLQNEPPTEDSVPSNDAVTDPTIANAGMTELEDIQPAITNGFTTHNDPEPATSPSTVPEQSNIDASAANAVAESHWDIQASGSTTGTNPEGWVEVPRDPGETDTGFTATPAATHSTSWAEDIPVEAPVAAVTTNDVNDKGDDGFEQVVHHNRPGGGRGRGHRGGPRGARGEGGHRGGRGGNYNRAERGERGDRDRGGEFRGGRGRGGGGGRYRGGRARGGQGGGGEAVSS